VAGELSLSSLSPAQPRKDRKRVGRGPGSGKGRYAGRGVKGQKARAGSHMMRAGFEGGQMPSYMRMGKQRGSTSKDAMPIGPFRTLTWSVNVRDLEGRFAAGGEVTPEVLKAKGLIRNLRYDVKILGHGELSTKLAVSAHAFSKSAVEKIEAAGGTVTWLKPPKVGRKPKRAAEKPQAAEPAAEAAAEPEHEAAAEPEAAADPEAEAAAEPEPGVAPEEASEG